MGGWDLNWYFLTSFTLLLLGSILALSLAKGVFYSIFVRTLLGKSLEECRMLYLRLKEDIFASKSKPYDSHKLERHLKEVLGLEKLSSITHPK